MMIITTNFELLLKNDTLFERAKRESLVSFRKKRKFLAPERKPVLFSFVTFLFVRTKRKVRMLKHSPMPKQTVKGSKHCQYSSLPRLIIDHRHSLWHFLMPGRFSIGNRNKVVYRIWRSSHDSTADFFRISLNMR